MSTFTKMNEQATSKQDPDSQQFEDDYATHMASPYTSNGSESDNSELFDRESSDDDQHKLAPSPSNENTSSSVDTKVTDPAKTEIATLQAQLAAASARISELESELGSEATVNTKYVDTPDTDLSKPQFEGRIALRQEMAARTSKRITRVLDARSEVESKVGRGTIDGSTYHFTTGRPVRTDVIVGRGVVSNPMAAAFEIIPMASASSPLFVFTDETVNSIYGDAFVQGFVDMGYNMHKIVLPDGEDAKTLEMFAKYADEVLSTGIDKNSVLISLGGGAVANVCGFIASTLHRGIGLIHFPTTLLAQCDASISHKQAVNAPHGKNVRGPKCHGVMNTLATHTLGRRWRKQLIQLNSTHTIHSPACRKRV